MPASKKRKKKKQGRSGPPLPKNKVTPKKKITKQQILIYVISGVMILSLAIGFIASGGTRTRSGPTPLPRAGNTLLVETPLPGDQTSEKESSPAPDTTPEPTAEN